MSDEHQYLTFLLNGEEYAIDILRVQEIKGYSAITPIPNTPPHLRGVMNLRGNVVPVIDLRLRLGMEPAPYGQFTVIVLVMIGTRVHGMIVDAVSDVLHLAPAAIEPPPDLGASVDTSFINGMAKPAGRLIILLNVDRVVGVETALPAQLAATAVEPAATHT